MTRFIYGHAISRLDGSDQDGIHLMWSPPTTAGYSVKGYDIQRKVSSPHHKIVCKTFNYNEMEILHRNLRYEFKHGIIGVAQSPCPHLPENIPDKPHHRVPKEYCLKIDPSKAKNPFDNNHLEYAIFNTKKRLLKKNTYKVFKDIDTLFGGNTMQLVFKKNVQKVSFSGIFLDKTSIIQVYDEKNKLLEEITINGEKDKTQHFNLKENQVKTILIQGPKVGWWLMSLCYSFPPKADGFNEFNNDKDLGAASFYPKFEGDFTTNYLHHDVAFFRQSNTTPSCILYTINFNDKHQWVEVTTKSTGFLAIAFRDEKVVDTKLVPALSNLKKVKFENRSVDKVLLYTEIEIKSLIVCVDTVADKKTEDRHWSGVPFLVKGLQLPLRTIHPTISTEAEELDEASQRIQGSENLNKEGFKELSSLMNDAAKLADTTPVTYMMSKTRNSVQDPFLDISPWEYGLSIVMQPTWRRILGFGYLDNSTDLVPGTAYDYRISGYFMNRDVAEKFLGFHTIPDGTVVPFSFKLNGIRFQTFSPQTVTMFPKVTKTTLRTTGRKGIHLKGNGGKSLKIRFPESIQELVLEFEPNLVSNLSYEAKTSSFLFGIDSTEFSGPLNNDRRILLKFPEPIAELTLIGDAFLYGIRLPLTSEFEDPESLTQKTFIIRGIIYEPTPLPASPPFLGTQNYQEAAVIGDPVLASQNTKKDLGFDLNWLPPFNSEVALLPWPDDLEAAPPFEGLGFEIERRRIDTPTSFEPIEQNDDKSTLFLGSRSGAYQPPTLYYGIDLLKAFPIVSLPVPPVPVFMNAQDILFSGGKKIGVPGGLYQYRISTIDSIGRNSETPTLGSVVRLEKWLAPPQPVAPTSEATAEVIESAGVRIRVIQKNDPNIGEGDKALLGSSNNVILLEWGWTDVQRQMDPFAKEFRVYWKEVPPDRVSGRLVGTPSVVGGNYRVSAVLNQAVQVNVLVNKYLKVGGYPFKIISHTDGQNISYDLAPSPLDSSKIPVTGDFILQLAVKGEELRASEWDQRVEVIQISMEENYTYLFRDIFALNAEKAALYSWIGVSTADDQSYVPDEIPSSDDNGGRPGNESSIATVTAQARYYGRPIFSVPDPLADVPEIRTKEPSLNSVGVVLDLPTFFGDSLIVPSGHKVIIEKISASKLLPLINITSSNTIRVSFPVLQGGAPVPSEEFTLSNPSDHADFLFQLRKGIPPNIEGKFLMNLVIRFLNKFDNLWDRVTPEGINYGILKDILPEKPARYIYRVRLVDGANHFSEKTALLPLIVRVPSLRSPSPPVIEAVNSNNDLVPVTLKVKEAYDLKWVFIFVHTMAASLSPDPATTDKAQLLRLPNRMDLYPDNGIRLRLQNGTLLSPFTVLPVTDGTLQVPERIFQTQLDVEFDEKIAIWGVTLTRDGIPSPFGGPLVVTTGAAPLTVPTPTLIRIGNQDDISWISPLQEVQVSVERKINGNDEWERVSPWFSKSITSFSVGPTSGEQNYRLTVKGRRGNVENSAPVNII